MKSEQIVAQDQDGKKSLITDRSVVRVTGHRQTRTLPAMPIEVIYDSDEVAVSLTQSGDEIEFRIDFPEKSESGWREIHIEAFSTRDTFLEIRTPGEALEFLRISGFFRGIDDDKRHERLSWANFQRWQGIVGILLRREFSQCERFDATQPQCGWNMRYPSIYGPRWKTFHSRSAAGYPAFPTNL